MGALEETCHESFLQKRRLPRHYWSCSLLRVLRQAHSDQVARCFVKDISFAFTSCFSGTYMVAKSRLQPLPRRTCSRINAHVALTRAVRRNVHKNQPRPAFPVMQPSQLNITQLRVPSVIQVCMKLRRTPRAASVW